MKSQISRCVTALHSERLSWRKSDQSLESERAHHWNDVSPKPSVTKHFLGRDEQCLLIPVGLQQHIKVQLHQSLTWQSNEFITLTYRAWLKSYLQECVWLQSRDSTKDTHHLDMWLCLSHIDAAKLPLFCSLVPHEPTKACITLADLHTDGREM